MLDGAPDNPLIEYSIRGAKLRDLPMLVAIENEAFQADRFSAGQLRYLVSRAQGCFLVAEWQEAIFGYALTLYRKGSRLARLYGLATSPMARSRGLAKELVCALAQDAHHRGCRFLSLEVREDNDAARALYQKLGFHETGRVEGYYQGDLAAIRMRSRELSDPAWPFPAVSPQAGIGQSVAPRRRPRNQGISE